MANAGAPSDNRKPATAKRAVNVTVRADLVEEAKAYGTNISAVLERALEAEHRQQRAERWRRENRSAVQAWNEWIDKNGIPFSDLRPW